MLTNVSNVAAAAFCPFIASAAPGLCKFESWTDLYKSPDLARDFDGVEYTQWKSYRDSEESRFVTLTMPRTLARLPYGKNTRPIDEFDFEEVALADDGKSIAVPHEEYCWMSTAYVMGAKLTDAYKKFGFCVAIRGYEAGGKVEGLPAHIFKADDGDLDLKCPTEITITEARERELSDQGFLPLCHYKNTDYAVFFGAQSTQKPKKFRGKNADAANRNADISARLPYLMAVSRFAHYLKVIARDKIGSAMERDDVEDFLNEWIADYVCVSKKPSPEEKASLPLAEAKVSVKDVGAGSYEAVAWLRPWMQLEELSVSQRLVARIPKMKS